MKDPMLLDLSCPRTLLIDRFPSDGLLLQLLIEDAGIPTALEVFPHLVDALSAMVHPHPPPGMVIVGDMEDDTLRVDAIHQVRQRCPLAAIGLLLSCITTREQALLHQTFPDIPCWEKATNGIPGYAPVLRYLMERCHAVSGQR